MSLADVYLRGGAMKQQAIEQGTQNIMGAVKFGLQRADEKKEFELKKEKLGLEKEQFGMEKEKFQLEKDLAPTRKRFMDAQSLQMETSAEEKQRLEKEARTKSTILAQSAKNGLTDADTVVAMQKAGIDGNSWLKEKLGADKLQLGLESEKLNVMGVQSDRIAFAMEGIKTAEDVQNVAADLKQKLGIDILKGNENLSPADLKAKLQGQSKEYQKLHLDKTKAMFDNALDQRGKLEMIMTTEKPGTPVYEAAKKSLDVQDQKIALAKDSKEQVMMDRVIRRSKQFGETARDIVTTALQGDVEGAMKDNPALKAGAAKIAQKVADLLEAGAPENEVRAYVHGNMKQNAAGWKFWEDDDISLDTEYTGAMSYSGSVAADKAELNALTGADKAPGAESGKVLGLKNEFMRNYKGADKQEAWNRYMASRGLSE